TTGEMNRRDGLTDVIVAVEGNEGARVLVFEGPTGALRAEPEGFDLPARATSLALGQLDDDYSMDLLIAAEHELLVVHGRDRKLSLSQVEPYSESPVRVSERNFPFNIRQLTIGDFDGDAFSDVAVLSEAGNVRV